VDINYVLVGVMYVRETGYCRRNVCTSEWIQEA